jgi:hypothetical protein
MSPRPVIFISAVSSELRSARQLVANTLTFLGYEPEWQEVFGTEHGDLRAMLRRRIDSCKGVVQLVGKCYGAEPALRDEQFGRVSYTQYEALYAGSKGKRVWYLFLDESFPTDGHEGEGEEKEKLQSAYRAQLQADSHLYHPLGTREGLEASILKLRDDLTRLRRGVKRWAAFVAVLLIFIVALSIWLLQGELHTNQQQQQTNQQLQAIQEKFDKLQQGVNSFAQVQNQVRQEEPGQKPEELEEHTYEELGKELGIDANTLKEQLPRFAEELKKASNASTLERANAAYVGKDYNEAERLALAAAAEAQRAGPGKNSEAIKAFELAGWAADGRVEYADAIERLRAAEKLTDRTRDPVEWARVQFALAYMLDDQGQYSLTEGILREVLKEREHVLGPEHPETLRTRMDVANSLYRQGKYAEAEVEYRAVRKLLEKVLGPEHPTTQRTGMGVANALDAQGKYAEAEAEYRAVLEIQRRVLGPDHPDTLMTGGNLAKALDDQGKYSDAEAEEREVLKLQEKVLGPEHPDTLRTRDDLAGALEGQGKHAEAESEYRAVLKLKEKVLGPEHPDTLSTCYDLARCLHAEGANADATDFARRAANGARKVLGADHPDTKKYEKLQQDLLVKVE